jgi:hypothetical protein
MARSRRTPRMLILPMPLGAFHHRSRIWRTPHGLSPWTEDKKCRSWYSGIVVEKLSNFIGKISILGVLRLRAIKLFVMRRSAKRFAQDDGFVWELAI